MAKCSILQALPPLGSFRLAYQGYKDTKEIK
jgi:hypothetical protein